MKVLTRGFYGISADVNQAENKKQHHNLFYMKWNFCALIKFKQKEKFNANTNIM